MIEFRRYAIYDLGPNDLAQFGADWLGWDARAGVASTPIGPPHWTDTPRRYGFHATLKAPFRLADGVTVDAVAGAVAVLAADMAPLSLAPLALAQLGGFLALVPQPSTALQDLALRVVTDLDHLRAALTDAEIARRDPDSLTDTQQANLLHWGYPYVGDDFRYHMTLTGQLSEPDAEAARARLGSLLTETLLAPHQITALALMGEDEAGMFHLIRRFPLSAG